MIIYIRGDDHFALNSSIIMGSAGSTQGRLDSLIKAYKWFYTDLAKDADMTVDLGDLTDTSTLRSEEITAISEAFSYRNSNIPELYILGNHERLSSDGEVNAVNFLKSNTNYDVVTSPHYFIKDRVLFCGMPYQTITKETLDGFKSWIKSLDKIDKSTYDRKVLFTHNDMYGADLGGWVSKSGLDPKFISKNFDMTFNGHIHNGSWVEKNVLNLGSLSGQNFSSKFVNWEPSVARYNTETNKIDIIPNPEALKFRTINAKTKSDLVKQLSDIKPTDKYGISVKVPLDLVDESRRILSNTKGILSSRVQEKISKEPTNEDTGPLLSSFDDSMSSGYKTLKDYIDTIQLPKEIDKKEVLSVIKEIEEDNTSES